MDPGCRGGLVASPYYYCLGSYAMVALSSEEMIRGIKKEERRVIEYEQLEYNDWSYWRASFLRGQRRRGVEGGDAVRISAAKMKQLLLEASGSKKRENELCRCATLGNITCTSHGWQVCTQAFFKSSLGANGNNREEMVSSRPRCGENPRRDQIHTALP